MAIIASLPVTLANGTTADATQVMSDFNFIVSQVNANSSALAGGNVFTGTQVVPVSSARNQAPQTSQVQDSSFVYAVDSSVTVNLLTLSLAPAITAYVEGQSIKFKPANTNTGATTVNVNTVGAKNVFAFGSAMVGGEFVVGIESEIVYDGTQFALITPSASLGPVNKQGANIASAATVNLETATGEYVHITGVTTITAITLSQGHKRFVIFDGALTLTNGASLILPGAANIITAAGDFAFFEGEAASVVRCLIYQRAIAVGGKQPTRQVLTSGAGATYTTGLGATRINIRMVGGGGGGGGSGAGGNATASTWSGGSLSAGLGVGGSAGAAGGAGGTSSNGDINLSGGSGTGVNALGGRIDSGGCGGNGAFGGGGGGGAGSAGPSAGTAGATNSGGGGGGGASTAAGTPGAGGGSGGYCEKTIITPAATYTYTIGAAGSAGASNANTAAGASGGAGIIIVDEYYN